MRTENQRTVTLDQIADLPVYPVADLFPMLSEDAVTEAKRPEGMTLRELAESIRDNGLQEPIVLIHGDNGQMLLDGRNRRAGCLKAAKMLGLKTDEFEIQVEDFVGSEEEADEFVLALNIDRRDLTPGQRAFVAVGYWDEVSVRHPDGRPAESSENIRRFVGGTAKELAERFRVNYRYVEEARAQKKKLQEAQTQIDLARQEAERQRAIEAEAKLELEKAREVGDTSRVKDAAHKATIASHAATNAQEKLEEKAQEVSQKQAKIAKVQAGKESLNSLRAPSPGQTITADDPVAKFRGSLNNATNNFKEAAKALLEGGRPEDRENVRLKLADLNREFGNIEPVAGLINS